MRSFITAILQGIKGLEKLQFDLETLDVLVYEVGAEDGTLKQVERLSRLETCHQLMQMVSLYSDPVSPDHRISSRRLQYSYYPS